MPNWDYYFARRVRKLALYSNVIHLFKVMFKKRDSVPSARYSSVCNVLRQWRIWLIPTYRVYRLYDIFSVRQSGAGGGGTCKCNQFIEVQYNDVNMQHANINGSMKLHNTKPPTCM